MKIIILSLIVNYFQNIISRRIVMKRKFLLGLSTILTIIYLMNFSGLPHVTHGILLAIFFILIFYTQKLFRDANKLDFKYRTLINSLFIVVLLFPVFISPDYFNILNKIFRVIASLFLISKVISYEIKQNKINDQNKENKESG